MADRDTGKGLSSADFTRRAQVSTIQRRNGAPAEPDPLEKTLRDGRMIAAAKMQAGQVAQLDTDAAEQEIRKMTLETQREELRQRMEELRGRGGGGEMMAYLLEELKDTRAGLAAAQDRANASQQEILSIHMTVLQEKINELNQGRAAAQAAPQLDPVEIVVSQLELGQRLRSILGLDGPSAAAQVEDPRVTEANVRMFEIRQNMLSEQWRIDRQMRHELDMAKIEADKSVKMAALTEERARREQDERFKNQTLPKALEMLRGGLDNVLGYMEQRAGTAPAAGFTPQPAAAQAYSESEDDPIPPGAGRMRCDNCGRLFNYELAYRGMLKCPYCGTEYDIMDPPGAAQEPAAAQWRPAAPPEPQPQPRRQEGVTSLPIEGAF